MAIDFNKKKASRIDFNKRTTSKIDFTKRKKNDSVTALNSDANNSSSVFDEMRKHAEKVESDKQKIGAIAYRLQGFTPKAAETKAKETKGVSTESVQKWFEKVQTFSSNFKQADTSVYNPEYGKEYTEDLEELSKIPENGFGIIAASAKDADSALSALKAYTDAVAFVNSAKEHINSVQKNYAEFKNKDEWIKGTAGWLVDGAETTEKTVKSRQDIYNSIISDMEKIQSEIKDKGYRPYQKEYKNLTKKYEVLESEKTQYERTQKKTDSHFKITQKEDFKKQSTTRDYDNVTTDEMYAYLEKADPETWDYDKNGNLISSDGTKIVKKNGKNTYPSIDKIKKAFDDPLGIYLASNEEVRKTGLVSMTGYSDNYTQAYDDIIHKGAAGDWDQLTEKEKSIYYYYLNTEGKEKALSYLDDMTITTNKRRESETQKKINSAEGLEKLWMNVLSAPANIFGGTFSLIGDVADAVQGKEYNPYSGMHSVQHFGNTVRTVTAKDIDEATDNASFLGITWGDVYQSGMSGVDSLAASAFGSTGASVLLGTSSATTEMKRLYEDGASSSEIFFGGLTSGAAEMVFEKYSIDKLIDIGDAKTIKQFVVGTLKQGGVEASEEAFTTIANTITDAIIRGNTSDLSKNIDKYKESGLSQGAATVRALGDVGTDVWRSAAGGFISGIGMGGTASAPQLVDSKIQDIRVKNFEKKISDLEFGLDELSDPKQAKTVTKGITEAAIKSTALGGTTKQAMLDNMSERGYMPSDVIESKTKDAELSEETLQTITNVTDKLDAAFASAWYGSDGVAAGREAAAVYVQAAAIGDAISALKLAQDVESGKITGAAAQKAIKKAAAILPASVRSDYTLGYDVINAANTYIDAFNNTLPITSNTASIEQALSDIIKNTDIKVDPAVRSALNDIVYNGNIAQNIDIVLADPGATEILSELLGFDITAKTTKATVIRKLRDMINTSRTGQGELFRKVAVQKKNHFKYYEGELKALNCDHDVIDGFKNAILNGKLTKAQARAIAADTEAYKLYVKATAGRLGANPTIDDMIKAAGYTAGFDLSSDISPYYDKGYIEAVESDTLVPEGEVGLYDPTTGTVTLNKKAPLDKKLAYRLARELLRDIDTADPDFRLDGSGKLHFDGDMNTLTELQRGSIKALERLSDALGIDIYIETELGTNKNGWFDHSDNSIHISLDAGTDGRGTLLFTAAHELTHFIKKYSPEKWQSMTEFVIVKGFGPDVDVGKLIRDKQNLYKENGIELTNDQAEQEIVADACEQMLIDGSAFEALAELRKTDATLFERIKYFIVNLVAKIRNLYKDIAPGSVEAKYISEMNGAAAKLQQLFNDALADADTNFTSGKSQSSDDGIQYSISKNAEKDIQNILADKFYEEEVKLTDSTPSIMLGHKGVRNLPLMMLASHVRENILTEAEAKKLGLVIKGKHYHGLGETLFLDVIRDLDNITEAYRGTKRADNADRRENYFLLISKHKDANGDEINIPVYINEKGKYNKIEIDVNKIATIFGKERLRNYLLNEIRRGNIVKIKNRSAQQSREQTALIAGRYRKEPSIARDAQASSKAETIAAEHDMYNSNNNISNFGGNVNTDSKNNQNSIRNAPARSVSKSISGSLTSNILTYMRSHGYDMDSEYVRVAKKLNPYFIEHRSRVGSPLLSDNNLNHEIVADFLTKVFTDSAAMEKLADNDLDLAVDLAERVKAYADTATDKQMKDFANDVCKKLVTVIRSDERADELQAVLHNRTQNGIDSPVLYDSIDKGRIDFSERDEDSVAAKVKDWYNNLKRGFVDSGEAIARLGKLLDNETIYHKYNNTKQSQDAIAYMLEKAQTDIEGNKIGKSLKDVFKPIIADKGKYEKFCLYMQYINNAERAVNGKAIFSDMTKEQSLERAESLLRANPEFKAWADDVYKYNEGLMNWLIDSSLLTRDQYNEMKEQNPHYVPAFIVDNTKHDKPSFIESVVVKKTVKRAKGGAEEVMPLLDAMQLKTSQIIKEARMNMLALEIVDTMKRKDLLEDGPKGFTVKDPALEEFIYQITAVRDSKYYEPTKVNGKYVTVNTNRKLKDDIKDLFSFADGKKNEARNIVGEYVRKLTYSETFVASDAEALAQELIDRAISPGANADALYYQYPELRADLANTKLYVPPETVSEIPDYSDFKNSLFGRVTLTTREGYGTHVDTAYTIWSGAYPGLFDPDIINTTDQIYKIKEVVENLRKPPEVTLKQMHGKNIGAVKAELTDNIKRLSIQAVKDAHSERAEIEKDVEAHAFATYEISSTNNLEFAKGEQDGNRMVFYADGIRHTMDIGKGVFEGLKNISFDPDAKTALKPVQKLNDGFKKLVTSYNPFFSVRNFIRDLQDAVMYSSDTKGMLRNLPQAYKEIATNGEMWQLYQSLGGVGSSYFDFKKQIDLENDLSAKSKLKLAYGRMSGMVEQINQAVEQAPRLAEFMTVLEKSDGSYTSKLKALYAAADVTVNFGRSGIYSRFLNSTVVPFYNPGVQGLSRFVRMFSEKKGTKQLIMLSAKLVVLGFAVGGINDLLNAIWEAANDEEDETYDQLTDYQKQNNILIPIGDGRYIKIPKGRSLNVFGIGAQNVIDMVQGEDVDWIGSIKTAAGQISPNDPFTDNLVAPLIAAGNNRTWYGSSIESAADEQVDPSQRYDETTDYFSRWLGGVLNYSPKKIHYVLDAYTGVVGDYVLPILTPKGGGNVFENIAMTAGSNFLVDGTTSNRVSSDYYSLIDELTYEKNDTSGADTTSATVALRFMNSQTKAIREFYAEIQKVNSGDLSPNEKAEKSRGLKATLNGIMLNAMASEQEVYEAAKNIESKYAYEKDGTYYNEIGEELTEEAYIDIIYREVNREVFGAEYALQVYGADTYKSAAEAVNNGATYDLYYDAYFGTKNIEGDYDPDKGRDKTGTARLNKWAEVNKLDASRSEKVALARLILKIDDAKIEEVQDSGVDLYDYVNFLCDTGVMSSTAFKSKKEMVLSYINRMKISRKEKDAFYILAGYSEKTLYDAPWR